MIAARQARRLLKRATRSEVDDTLHVVPIFMENTDAPIAATHATHLGFAESSADCTADTAIDKPIDSFQPVL